MQLKSLVAAMEKIAPTHLAESWDNVGLLVGDPEQPITRLLLTIDYTDAVADEARLSGCDCVVSYHPPIFDALKRVTATAPGTRVFDAIRRGVAIYSPHTALDVAPGGTNDMLADVLELRERRPLKSGDARQTECKLVTFVPEDAAERVSDAIFAAGAGQIGGYSRCSFRSTGTGTFLGGEGTSPAIGSAGKEERVAEIRLETIVPMARVDAVISALRKAHPYEQVAFDLNVLASAPSGVGIGRIGRLPGEVSVDMLVNRLKRELEVGHMLVAGDISRIVRTCAVCAGACGKLLDDAIQAKADLYVTGEMRHHDALKATAAGMTVICTLHSNSERAVLKRLRDRLSAELPGLPTILSTRDSDPFAIV